MRKTGLLSFSMFLAGIIVGCIILCSIQSFNDPSNIFTKVSHSIVEVKSTFDGDEMYGSAVFIDENRLITNSHVVVVEFQGVSIEMEHFIRFYDQEEYIPVSVEKYDIEKDIAVLTVDSKIGNPCIIERHKPAYGDKVYAVGNGSNLGITITEGIISNPSLNIEYLGTITNTIQCDLTISPGNSGGALLNKTGNLIGITTFRLKSNSVVAQGICYSLPISLFWEYL